MSYEFEADASFLQLLVVIDQRIAGQVRAQGCVHCGGPLHRGDYVRKPRGLPRMLEAAFSSRHSWCCGWCRKRCTPPSVRFLGRKVYVGWLVLVAVMRWLVGIVSSSVPRRTVRRWRHWWQGGFSASSFWDASQGLFAPPPPATSQLPTSLVDRFTGSVPQRLRFALAFVAPTTTVSASWVQVILGHAEDGV